ncbi:hypothetical protein DPMN_152365 [Dreissena polymorpha]|uniref:Uncharacterized protein n=1 Tax=Dreissena polymorpha TaxID=45954 RepID=A0A9D4FI57_DREPO|nr:hypothetical protein DPMN_152365 [Dreissena polymorpha]
MNKPIIGHPVELRSRSISKLGRWLSNRVVTCSNPFSIPLGCVVVVVVVVNVEFEYDDCLMKSDLVGMVTTNQTHMWRERELNPGRVLEKRVFQTVRLLDSPTKRQNS